MKSRRSEIKNLFIRRFRNTNMFKDKDINEIIKQSVKQSFENSGLKKESASKVQMGAAKTLIQTVKEKLNESFVLTPKTFLLKTEYLSMKAKEAHEKLYNGYVKAFDKVTVKTQTASTEESDSNNSDFRSLKMDEQFNLNGIKLHELFFYNISDLSSSISVDSIPYMRLARDFGTFEKWQYDFRACCLGSREGWAVTYYEPLRNVYMTCIVDGHTTGIPIGGIPVIVIDMWAHSYYRDYLEDKKSYVNAMMKELNWNIIEARMVVAERSRLNDLFEIRPLVNEMPQKILSNINQEQAPIGNDQIDMEGQIVSKPGGGSWQQPNAPIGGAKGSF
jgi:superoxide dismutase, Fe-Mn family